MSATILRELADLGQAAWLDFISRKIIKNGELHALVESGLRGVTSNPTIFCNAITGSNDYDDALRAHLARHPGASAEDLYEALTVADVRDAADILRPVYDRTEGADGFVSLEVSPLLAHDTAGTIAEARRLWRAVDRPNLMIKVPGTAEGVPAIEALIAEGIHVNVTLLFSLGQHEAIARAFVAGLQRTAEPSRVQSVASFFVSRVDNVVDKALGGREDGADLRGRIAVANAKRAYALYERIFSEAPFRALAGRGARVQRPLWASTGTKNPAYSDLLYVETLVGPNTVNTLPPATLAALRDHGRARDSIREGLAEADAQVARLPALGIDLEAITATLQTEGVALFAKSYRELLAALDVKRRAILSSALATCEMSLGALRPDVDAALDDLARKDVVARVWAKDGTVWSTTPLPELTDRLGWLTLPEVDEAVLQDLQRFAQGVAKEGLQHIVLLGMGGSSLAPEVFQRVFGPARGFPTLTVLDTTHPDAVHAATQRLDLNRALVLVSSKSGSTPESTSLCQFFWDRLAHLGAARGSRFAAITDPGTSLEKLARARGWRRVFAAPSDVGGRYSALSMFGLVPAALCGVDVRALVRHAAIMSDACGAPTGPCPNRRAHENPGFLLGAALGVAARAGRDKVTFTTSPAFAALPAWIEQLVAESTGKDDVGIVPVDGEALGAPAVYGADRVFVSIALAAEEGGAGAEREAKLGALEAAGHPVVRVTLPSLQDLGQELFRWELATAVASAVLGIHPFNQPDVQLAKDKARSAMARTQGASAAGVPVVSAQDGAALRASLAPWLASIKAGDYVGLHAYLAPSPELTAALEGLRVGLRNRLRVATTLGYGPRFLHSTGQLHKGGASNGAFLQLVDTPAQDLVVPETDFTFGRLIRAQADGDAEALTERGRRLVRVDLGVGGTVEKVRSLAEQLAQLV